MGLSLHIHTHAPASLDIDAVGNLVANWHAIARTFAAEGRVDHVCELSNEAEDLAQFATRWLSTPHPTEPDATFGIAAPPFDGWVFLVQLGAGCEPQTQYASLHGWEHFRRCHLAAAELAADGQTVGVGVKIDDEGGSVESPILEHPHFERLEAEAEASPDAQKISAALRAIRKEMP